jgi:hypothetical protein
MTALPKPKVVISKCLGFEACRFNGEVIQDKFVNVQYAPPGGALFKELFVERDIRRIFAYRSEQLQKIFGQIQLRSPLGRVRNPTALSTR